MLTSHRWLLNVFKDPPTVEKHETVSYQLGRCWVYQRESLSLCSQRSLWRFVRQFECQVWDGMTHPLRSKKKRESDFALFLVLSMALPSSLAWIPVPQLMDPQWNLISAYSEPLSLDSWVSRGLQPGKLRAA